MVRTGNNPAHRSQGSRHCGRPCRDRTYDQRIEKSKPPCLLWQASLRRTRLFWTRIRFVESCLEDGGWKCWTRGIQVGLRRASPARKPSDRLSRRIGHWRAPHPDAHLGAKGPDPGNPASLQLEPRSGPRGLTLPCFLSRLQEGSGREGVDRRVPLDASQLPQGPVADPLGRREIPSQPTGARLRELGRGRPSRSVPATPRERTLPADCLRASLRPHALANFCPDNLGELHVTAPIKLKTAQHGPSIITACWTRTSLRRCQAVRNAHQSLLPPRCTRYTS